MEMNREIKKRQGLLSHLKKNGSSGRVKRKEGERGKAGRQGKEGTS